MKKLLTTILAAAMLLCAALPVAAAESNSALAGTTANGEWTVTDDAITSNVTNSNYVFTNDRVEAGKITVTIDRTNATSPGHDGIIFCASESGDKFWEQEINSYYFMFIQGDSQKIGLAKSGKMYNGWQADSADRYVIPAEDQTGVYTLTAEWDCSGTIKAYLNGEHVYTWNDSDPLPGTRFGLRAASVGVSFKDVTAVDGEVAEGALRNGKANAIPGTVSVDGQIDDAWANAPEYEMKNVVVLDSKKDDNGNPSETDSSNIKFRMMYGDGKVYMLFVVEDDVFINSASNTNWKNDALFIYLSEDGVDRSQNSDKSTTLCAFFENYSADKADRTGLIVRSGKGANNNPKEHAVVIDGNTAVMEISFSFNTKTIEEGKSFVMDLQYNDNDDTSGTRSIVWAWSCSHTDGPNNIKDGLKGWGDVYFVAAPVCEHKDTEVVNAKEATETEKGYTGDTVCKDCGETVKEGEETPVKAPATEEKPPVSEEPPVTKPAQTGDTTVMLSALALVALAGAVVVTRRRKISE